MKIPSGCLLRYSTVACKQDLTHSNHQSISFSTILYPIDKNCDPGFKQHYSCQLTAVRHHFLSILTPSLHPFLLGTMQLSQANHENASKWKYPIVSHTDGLSVMCYYYVRFQDFPDPPGITWLPCQTRRIWLSSNSNRDIRSNNQNTAR